MDIVKKFINTTWHNINKRTVNGLHKKDAGPSHLAYINRGIRVNFTRQEFADWCNEHKSIILKFYALNDKPSIDRICSKGHYEIGNIRIISYTENCKQGPKIKMRNKTAELNALPPKYCLYCGKIIKRNMENKRPEPKPAFLKRKTCNKSCATSARERDKYGRMKRTDGN